MACTTTGCAPHKHELDFVTSILQKLYDAWVCIITEFIFYHHYVKELSAPNTAGKSWKTPGRRSPCPAHVRSKAHPPSILSVSLKSKKKTKTLVELQGFEPWTPALQRQCSSQLSYSPFSSATVPKWAWQELNRGALLRNTQPISP